MVELGALYQYNEKIYGKISMMRVLGERKTSFLLGNLLGTKPEDYWQVQPYPRWLFESSLKKKYVVLVSRSQEREGIEMGYQRLSDYDLIDLAHKYGFWLNIPRGFTLAPDTKDKLIAKIITRQHRRSRKKGTWLN